MARFTSHFGAIVAHIGQRSYPRWLKLLACTAISVTVVELGFQVTCSAPKANLRVLYVNSKQAPRPTPNGAEIGPTSPRGNEWSVNPAGKGSEPAYSTARSSLRSSN